MPQIIDAGGFSIGIGCDVPHCKNVASIHKTCQHNLCFVHEQKKTCKACPWWHRLLSYLAYYG